MTAQDFLGRFPKTCVFFKAVDNHPCGEPAVAVYISDDLRTQARYVCEVHAFEAERRGDGPVFWAKPTRGGV